MVTIKLDPTELQFLLAAVSNAQIYGKDAHLVSKCMNKIEDKLKTLTQVEPK